MLVGLVYGMALGVAQSHISFESLGRERSLFPGVRGRVYKGNGAMTHPVLILFPEGKARVRYVAFDDGDIDHKPFMEKEVFFDGRVRVEWVVALARLWTHPAGITVRALPKIPKVARVLSRWGLSLTSPVSKKIKNEFRGNWGLAAYILEGGKNKLVWWFVQPNGKEVVPVVEDNVETLNDPPRWPMTKSSYPITKAEKTRLQRMNS